MIFEALYESSEKNELLLIKDGMCRFHMRRDGVLTVREILVSRNLRGKGLGRWMVTRVVHEHPRAAAVVARCPVDLPANGFWVKMGFTLVGTSEGKRPVNTWRMELLRASP